MADQTIGERIAEARKRKGLSQKDFASLMGRSESWVSQVERGCYRSIGSPFARSWPKCST